MAEAAGHSSQSIVINLSVLYVGSQPRIDNLIPALKRISQSIVCTDVQTILASE